MATEKNSLDTRALLEALVGLKNGDFSTRLPVDWAGGGRKNRRHI